LVGLGSKWSGEQLRPHSSE